MKCIKEKCKYCNQHDLMYDFYSCRIGGSFFVSDENVSCAIDKEIKIIEEKLKSLKLYKVFIEDNQIKTKEGGIASG